jgi:D-alanine--poly(phosphoribitol) ligase subunit 1
MNTEPIYEYNLGLRFERVANQRTRQIAIWFDRRDSATYEELNRAANQIARLLIEHGVRASDVVCLSGEKSLYAFASMIACLKLGAIYSILDAESPGERLRKILSRCRPKVLLAEQGLLKRIEKLTGDLGIATIAKDAEQLSCAIEKFEEVNLPQTRSVTGANPAYIMFTSGSTGFPKGAVMTHANVLNLIDWSRETFRITHDDILTNVNPLYFDNSVFDFYSALFAGARLVPFSKAEVKDPKLLVEKIAAAGCTLWFSVPSLLIFLQTMKAADGKHLKSICRFIFGGEGYPKAKLKELFDAYSDSAEFFNVYGPTECTCICSSYKISARDFDDLQGLPPLGYIADNFDFLILDEKGRAVAPGESGELCLLGSNVGKGYYNDGERTALGFVQNPGNDKFSEVMYKTGDLVRFDTADGKLYIQGRKDNQIKHMGYRIELEEIEAALYCLDYISEAAVLHTSVNGFSRILAIVSAREVFDADRIRLDLKQFIPDYMIPAAVYHEEMLPKNANGKVDRMQLAKKYVRQGA